MTHKTRDTRDETSVRACAACILAVLAASHAAIGPALLRARRMYMCARDVSRVRCGCGGLQRLPAPLYRAMQLRRLRLQR